MDAYLAHTSLQEAGTPLYMAPEEMDGSGRVGEKCEGLCCVGEPHGEAGVAEFLTACLFWFSSDTGRNKTTRHRVDVYALGIILNECFTRRVPWAECDHFFQVRAQPTQQHAPTAARPGGGACCGAAGAAADGPTHPPATCAAHSALLGTGRARTAELCRGGTHCGAAHGACHI